MEQSAAHAPSVRRPEHHRCSEDAVSTIAHPGSLSHDLVEGGPDEICEFYLCNGPHSVHGRAEGDSRDGRFGQWRIDNPLFAKLLQKSVGCQKDPAAGRNVLTHDEDRRIAPHLLTHRLSCRLENRHYGDGGPPAYT